MPNQTDLPGTLDLGAFSISLNVGDLEVSRDFYAKLGFEPTGGSLDDNYLILKNGETTLGIFHGMFENNILTFNPGLTNRMAVLEEFTDVREIYATLTESGLETVENTTDAEVTGPAHFVLLDPDDNPILVDQHI